MSDEILPTAAVAAEVWELERLQAAKVTFRVTQGHWYWWHSIGHMLSC